ncbi:MAG: holo-ACP synthase [Lachnospiraceae bacterium]|nr:holo-ACP synthase [Lachnospiraceae bacterium]
MIVGIGTDIVEIGRIERAYSCAGFAQRVYTEREQELIGGRASRAAGNFAVKEAVVKAFGTGFRGIDPVEIEVLRDEAGKPYIVLRGAALARSGELGIRQLHVSISNERQYAIAFVTAED